MEEQIIEVQAAAANALFTTNNLWMMIATALVFIMHLGFSTLEIGFVRSKNVVNVLFKNVMILPIGLLTYYICGFNLMYPGFDGLASDWFGFSVVWIKFTGRKFYRLFRWKLYLLDRLYFPGHVCCYLRNHCVRCCC
jgi:ammonia channel protein AmtB